MDMEKRKDFFEGGVVVLCSAFERLSHVEEVCQVVTGRKPLESFRASNYSCYSHRGVRFRETVDGDWKLELVYSNDEDLPEIPFNEFIKRYETDQAPTNHRPSTNQVEHEVVHEVGLTPHHYASPMQAIDYIEANGLDFCEGNVVKYLTRWRKKGGVSDLEKAKYYVERLIKQAKDGDND